MRCNHCGKQIRQENRFCPYCGARNGQFVPRQDPGAAEDRRQVPVRNKRSAIRWLLPLAAAVLVLCVAIGLVIRLQKRPAASETVSKAGDSFYGSSVQEPEAAETAAELSWRIRRVSECSGDEDEAGLYRDYRYGADGRLAEITQYLYGGLINLQYVYEYNPDGTLSAEWFYLGDSNTGITPSGLTRYRYNVAGEKIAEIYYAAGIEDESMIEYRHDYSYENGLLKQDDMDVGWAINSQMYEYDGDVLQGVYRFHEDKDPNESPILSGKTAYTYDSDGRLSQARTADGSGKELEYVDYRYDENGNLSEELRYVFFNEHVDSSGKTTYDSFMLSSRMVYEYEPVPAEGVQPADTAASEAGGNELYVPLIRSFIEEAQKERYQYQDHGILCDLDGDAGDELLIFYVRDIPGGAGYALPTALCDVYDIRGGRVEPVFEGIEICSVMGGNRGEAGLARLGGEPYLYTRFRSGHNIGMQSTDKTILYDCREGRAAYSYISRYTLEIVGGAERKTGESCELNGSPCSEAEYSAAFAQIEFVDGIDMYESGRTLDEVLETIVGS